MTPSENLLVELADMNTTLFEAATTIAESLSGLAKQLEALRGIGADIVVSPDREKSKRELLATLADYAQSLRQAVDMVNRGPMDGKEFAAEVYATLMRGDWQWAKENDAADVICRERANNIAAAYAGRVLREPDNV